MLNSSLAVNEEYQSMLNEYLRIRDEFASLSTITQYNNLHTTSNPASISTSELTKEKNLLNRLVDRNRGKTAKLLKLQFVHS